MIKLLLLLIFSSSILAFGETFNEEDCFGYAAFGEAVPIPRHSLEMIEDLTEAVAGISSPASSYEKKVAFFQSILPDVVAEMDAVARERRALIEILQTPERTEEQARKIQKLLQKYDATEVEDLLLKVNVVPIDLVLVQSAMESGWGTSNAAASCNNFVGIQAHGELSVCDTPSRKIASFSDRRESFKSYLLSINRNEKYLDFRKRRAEILRNGEPFSGATLAPHLLHYSVRGEAYSIEVRDMIQSHKLDDVVSQAMGLANTCEFGPPPEE